jgi:hypothetical protein
MEDKAIHKADWWELEIKLMGSQINVAALSSKGARLNSEWNLGATSSKARE